MEATNTRIHNTIQSTPFVGLTPPTDSGSDNIPFLEIMSELEVEYSDPRSVIMRQCLAQKHPNQRVSKHRGATLRDFKERLPNRSSRLGLDFGFEKSMALLNMIKTVTYRG